MTKVLLSASLALSVTVVVAQESPRTGTVVLHAVDVDTKEPITDVEFMMSNTLAEDWYTALGSNDEQGQLTLQSKPRPGYYYSVWTAPDGYKVAGLDDIAAAVEPGKEVHRYFHLRKRPPLDTFPPVREVSESGAVIQVFEEVEQSQKRYVVVDNMPGFEGKEVKFLFDLSKGRVQRSQLELARLIFHNGERVHAAVVDELTYFQMAERDNGRIEDMTQIVIDLEEGRHWRFWCRLPNGLQLKQLGYRVTFTGLDEWELNVPDYLQPGF